MTDHMKVFSVAAEIAVARDDLKVQETEWNASTAFRNPSRALFNPADTFIEMLGGGRPIEDSFRAISDAVLGEEPEVRPLTNEGVIAAITGQLVTNNARLAEQFGVAGADGLTIAKMQTELENLSDGTIKATTAQLDAARAGLEQLGVDPTGKALDGMVGLIIQAENVQVEMNLMPVPEAEAAPAGPDILKG